MSDELEQAPSSIEETDEKLEEAAESQNTKASNTTNSVEDLIKDFAGKDKAEDISDLVRSLGVANVYIDARSGGAYFTDQVDITGDVVGGNQTKRTKRSSVKEVAGQILSANIEKIRSVYVETDSYQHVKTILDEKHLLILQGHRRFGKQTTAIHLLSTFNAEEIFEIDPAITDLSSFQCEAKQVYLIDTLAVDSAEKLNGYVLNGLSRKLKQQQSHLVITLESHLSISQESLGGYLFHWKDLPSTDKLLEKHLRWYITDQAMLDSGYSVAQSDAVRQLLAKQLLPSEIDTLASLLAKVASHELHLEEALARFGYSAYEQVKNWFEQDKREFSQRIFMITLAVLSGSSYQAVKDASQRLQLLVQPPSKKDEESDPTPVFYQTRSQLLKEVFANLVPGYENTEFGRTPVELVEFKNPTFQPAVISYVWHEYDYLREPLLIWLQELGSHGDSEVRIRAAAAIGELSKYAFRDVLNQVLRPWANSQNRSLQKLAALALSVPVFESNLAPQVLGLLHSWSTLKNNSNLRWTATSAYGGYVGLRFPDAALRDLFAITSSGEASLFSAVIESIVNLFASGKFLPNQYFNILSALQEWTAQTKITTPNQLGLLIFWRLMREDKVRVDVTEINNNHVPTLLWLAQENQIYEDLIVCLLRRALNFKATRVSILNEIHNWLKFVDYDHRFKRVLGRIIYTLVVQGNERERERILYKLNQWALIEPPNSASEILSVIKKHLQIY
ncbi:HEAT repeat domain-containing protein [Pelatocladus sp. BLCC-F211]|uniref:HEAT repeat domain-containing protein n=1 Tax=Pelatocladus sp. BLCC-F211 TaxID=3342752 RepID=UPI0035B7B6DF